MPGPPWRSSRSCRYMLDESDRACTGRGATYPGSPESCRTAAWSRRATVGRAACTARPAGGSCAHASSLSTHRLSRIVLRSVRSKLRTSGSQRWRTRKSWARRTSRGVGCFFEVAGGSAAVPALRLTAHWPAPSVWSQVQAPECEAVASNLHAHTFRNARRQAEFLHLAVAQ